jgi:hypothetical protein
MGNRYHWYCDFGDYAVTVEATGLPQGVTMQKIVG